MTLDRAECSDAHDFQFIAEIPLAYQTRDQLEIDTLVREKCNEAFGSFVGAAVVGSSIRLYTLTPTVESWANGNRSGECLAGPREYGLQIVGDAAGSLW